MQLIHTACDMFRGWPGPGEARRAAALGSPPKAGPGQQAPDQGPEESGRKPPQGRPSGQHPMLRSFRRPRSRKSQVHKRERGAQWPKGKQPPCYHQLFSSHRTKLPPWPILIPARGASPGCRVLWAPWEEAKRARRLPPGACLGGAAGKVPPPRDRRFQQCSQVAHPQKNPNQERQSTVCLFVCLSRLRCCLSQVCYHCP